MKFLYYPLSSKKCGPPPFVQFRVLRICFGFISTKRALVGQYGIHVCGALFSITRVISLGIHWACGHASRRPLFWYAHEDWASECCWLALNQIGTTKYNLGGSSCHSWSYHVQCIIEWGFAFIGACIYQHEMLSVMCALWLWVTLGSITSSLTSWLEVC